MTFRYYIKHHFDPVKTNLDKAEAWIDTDEFTQKDEDMVRNILSAIVGNLTPKKALMMATEAIKEYNDNWKIQVRIYKNDKLSVQGRVE